MQLETIQEAIKMAMKTHASLEVETLRAVVAAVKKAAIDKRCDITEELVDEMLLKEVKIIKEQIAACPVNRPELLDEYKHRLKIVETFAPTIETNRDTIRSMIAVELAQAGIEPGAAKGVIMKAVMPKLKGRVDMKIANELLNKLTVIQDPAIDIKDGACPIFHFEGE